ncbi:MAG: ABC transporter substrate-binding protein [Micrococcales bacterium]|nr:ABC transporter substrate-binding protein [Micrococcales bacterium]
MALITLLAAAGLALCSCGAAELKIALAAEVGGPFTPNPTPGLDPDHGPSGSQVEVFSWWTTGSEAQGLDALVDVLAAKHPGVSFVNGFLSAWPDWGDDPLYGRLTENVPPDSFQAYAGAEISVYIEAGLVQDVSNLYDEFGLTEAVPADLLDLVTKDGKKYSIPTGVHRANVLWASVPVLQDAGIDPNGVNYATISDFIKDLDKIKAASPNVTPLALGTTWTQVHLLECVLIAELGPDTYNGLWDGSTDPNGPEVTKALTSFEKLISYANADRDSIDWEPTTQMLIDGTAAFMIMGDWVPEPFGQQNLKMGTDWVWAPAPGTNHVFDFMADSFTLCTGAPDPEGVKAWLDAISSVDGQAALNKIKGSIPARVDVPMDGFSEYQVQAAEDYANSKIVGSLQHGAVATVAQRTSVAETVAFFTAGATNLEQFQQAFAEAING